MKVSGANAAWGRNYSRAFSDWLQQHPFPNMHASTRSHAIELHENIKAIEKWRASLPERKRQLINPQSVVKRWKASLAHGEQKAPQDLKRDAIGAWRRFVACIEAMPTEMAQPLKQQAVAYLAA
jgi:hypothetical protein